MPAPKGNNGYIAQRLKTPLERFAEKCQFDPVTGCVLWIGATTAGRGNTTRYGAFWDAGKVYAHRWAAVHIHGIELGPNEAGHCCPGGNPNSLCVQHLEGTTKGENVAERNIRVAKANQSNETRQFYLFKQLGILEPEPDPAPLPASADVPFHEPPEWFRPYLKPREANDDECPF